MIIDCHTHVGGFGGGGDFPFSHPDVEDLIGAMDRDGVDMSLIISNHLTGFGEGRRPEYILEKIKDHADRLRLITHVDFSRVDDEKYIKGLIEMLGNPMVVGLKFYLGYQSIDLCDSRFDPLYKTCLELGKPVVIHTGYLLVGVSADEKAAHPFNIERVLKKFPKIKFVAAHFGNPWVEECSEVLAKNENLHVDLSGYFTEFQSLSAEESAEFKEDVPKLLSENVDTSRLLFGTDWPLYMQKEYIEAVRSLPFSEEEFENIFWKNSTRVFDLNF